MDFTIEDGHLMKC